MNNKFPVFRSLQESKNVVYQSAIEVDELGTLMDGYFKFRYLRPGEETSED